jgi:long-chain acyl-CoA synthetase
MVKTAQKDSIKNESTDVLVKIRRGNEGLSHQERPELFGEINRILGRIVKEDQFETFPDLISIWNEIFESAAVNKLIRPLAHELGDDAFFALGKYILNRVPSAGPDLQNVTFRFIHSYLDVLRHPEFLRRIYLESEWEDLIHNLLEVSNFNLAEMFRQRIAEYHHKILFRVFHGKTETTYSWDQVGGHVQKFAFGLAKLAFGDQEAPVKIAFLMENSLNMAFLDLACLTTGLVNIMIPANSVPQHVEFILNQTQAGIILISDDKQLAKLKAVKNNLKYLKKAVLLHGSSIENWVISLNEMVSAGVDFPEEKYKHLQKSIEMNPLATIMYTSGTTGDPKGIMFSQMNLVYKRFCRAMALPEIGPEDRFLAYLPLYHTFGRYLEMLGSIFWGTEYAFMENPALNTMLDNMRRFKPTVFISIPKKWYQLYEHISQRVDIEFDEESEIKETLKEATGGELRWGLSAAGYLEPDIFKFFQQFGVELMSGFGMTEATGGITMTPPGKYIENSLGAPLPGIKAKLGEDGELLIKGGYVMLGYYHDPQKQSTFTDGWFSTGDVMQQDKNGFYEIIDRKKEIYKNIKGETIAPQKIENYFRDFEYVKQVFLVGDSRQFNTVLIFPDYEAGQKQLEKMNEDEKQTYFSSVVVAVNKFLAPYERIVDFRIINRPFSEAHGELTPKGTYKRRVIEKNFDSVINTMYIKNYTSLTWKKIEVRIPNWFLREKGLLTHDIQVAEDGLTIPKYDQKLPLKKMNRQGNQILIGDFVYQNEFQYIDLQILLSNPLYWLGNQRLFDFAGELIFQWYRLDSTNPDISYCAIKGPTDIPDSVNQKFVSIRDGGESSLQGLHLATIHLQSAEVEHGRLAIEYMPAILADGNSPYHYLALEIISRPNISPVTEIRREIFRLGLPHVNVKPMEARLGRFLEVESELLNEDLINEIVRESHNDDNLFAIEKIIKRVIADTDRKANLRETTIPSLLRLLATYGIQHPTLYKLVRQMIVRYQLREDWQQLSDLADEARMELLNGFRNWLGENQRVAVDVETGEEYRWKDVITFEDNIDPADQSRILNCVTNTSVIREAIFLFSKGNVVRLNDILPGGVWISLLSKKPEKAVYRVSVQTRYHGGYDIVLNLNQSHPMEKILTEINWLIHAETIKRGLSLVDKFGGFWRDYNLWSEEYTLGEPAAKVIQRYMRKGPEEPDSRISYLWPFFIWSAVAAHISFYRRTGNKLELVNKSITNVIIPAHDYQTGVRLISISKRKQSDSPFDLISDFYNQFIEETEQQYPLLKRDDNCFFIFSGIVDALGEASGLEFLRQLLEEMKQLKKPCPHELDTQKLERFLKETTENGFIPKSLYFAINRFHRWFDLNRDAAFEAQAKTLNDLIDTYQLPELEKHYPELRTRLFLETVFSDSSPELRNVLLEIVRKQHGNQLSAAETLSMISNIQNEFTLNEKESFFLTRLSYPHLKPTDYATLLSSQSEGTEIADVVVQLEDYDGKPYHVRKPISPKEISRLHQLFLDASMPVNFRPEDRFLVAISERGHIIGGLFYSQTDEKTVYMDKIVVSNRYRRKGISDGLMKDFFNRLRGEKVDFVTTGFFRPEYFYRFGFKIEKKYSGLAKDLREADPSEQKTTPPQLNE